MSTDAPLDTDSFVSNSTIDSSSEVQFDIVVNKMRELHEKFGTSSVACARINKRLNHITTATRWETFIHTHRVVV